LVDKLLLVELSLFQVPSFPALGRIQVGLLIPVVVAAISPVEALFDGECAVDLRRLVSPEVPILDRTHGVAYVKHHFIGPRY
jgi:hypothetical protein